MGSDNRIPSCELFWIFKCQTENHSASRWKYIVCSSFSRLPEYPYIHPIPFGVLSILSFLSICGNSNSTSSNRDTRSKWLRNVSCALLSPFLFFSLCTYVQLESYRENVNAIRGSDLNENGRQTRNRQHCSRSKKPSFFNIIAVGKLNN